MLNFRDKFLSIFDTTWASGLNLPVAALTDFDPRKPKKDGTEREPLGPKRAVTSLIKSKIIEGRSINPENYQLGEEYGMFLNSHTLEVELYDASLHGEMATIAKSLSNSKNLHARADDFWGDGNGYLDSIQFLKDIESISKGRFAQRLATVIEESDTTSCPEYILKGVKYVADKCQHA